QGRPCIDRHQIEGDIALPESRPCHVACRLSLHARDLQLVAARPILRGNEAVGVRDQNRAQAFFDGRELRYAHQYAASSRIPARIFSGETMNQSSRTGLYGTPGTSGPATRITGPSSQSN